MRQLSMRDGAFNAPLKICGVTTSAFHQMFFFGHRPKFFLMTERNLSQFSHIAFFRQKIFLSNFAQMTKMPQRTEGLSVHERP